MTAFGYCLVRKSLNARLKFAMESRERSYRLRTLWETGVIVKKSGATSC